MLSFKRIAGFLKKVGSRDHESGAQAGYNKSQEANSSNNNNNNTSRSAANGNAPGQQPAAAGAGAGADPNAAAGAPALHILHGLPANADTQAVLQHLQQLVARKTQRTGEDEVGWVLAGSDDDSTIISTAAGTSHRRPTRYVDANASSGADAKDSSSGGNNNNNNTAAAGSVTALSRCATPNASKYGGASRERAGPALKLPRPIPVPRQLSLASGRTDMESTANANTATAATPSNNRVTASSSATGTDALIVAAAASTERSAQPPHLQPPSLLALPLATDAHLLTQLQQERAEMIDALDVCLQEVPECEDEVELLQRIADAVLLDHDDDDDVSEPRSGGDDAECEKDREDGARLEVSQLGDLPSPLSTPRNSRWDEEPISSASAASHGHARLARTTSAGVPAKATVSDECATPVNAADEEAADDELEADTIGGQSYILENDEDDGNNEDGESGGGCSGAGRRRRATAVGNAALLRAKRLSKVLTHATQRSDYASAVTLNAHRPRTQTVSVYEWRLLLLQIVELLIGIDRAVYIELSQRATVLGTRRDELMLRHLENEAASLAAAVTGAVTAGATASSSTSPSPASAVLPPGSDAADAAPAASSPSAASPSPTSTTVAAATPPHAQDALAQRNAAAATATTAAAAVASDVKARKSAAQSTIRAVEDVLSTACALATWVTLRSLLQQHLDHIEEAALRYAEAESSVVATMADKQQQQQAEGQSPQATIESAASGPSSEPLSPSGSAAGERVAGARVPAAAPSVKGLAATSTPPLSPSPRLSPQAPFTSSAAGSQPTSALSGIASAAEQLYPLQLALARRQLSGPKFAAIGVEWGTIIADLQDLLSLPDVLTAACVMCASFLRDDGHELNMCLLQEPKPHAMMERMLHNCKRIRQQTDLSSLAVPSTGGPVVAGLGATAAATAPGPAAAAGKSSKGVSPVSSSSSAGAGGDGASSTSSAASSNTVSPALTRTPSPVGPALPGRAGSASLPLPTHGANGLVASSAAAAAAIAKGADTAGAFSPHYRDDIVEDDLLEEVERAYTDGVERTWAAYLESTILQPFRESASSAAAQSPSSDAPKSPARQPSATMDEIEEEREKDATTRSSEEGGGAIAEAVAAAALEAARESDPDGLLCQAATAYFFCSHQWKAAEQHSVFSALHQRIRGRMAAYREREDWVHGRGTVSVAGAMAAAAAAAAAARRRTANATQRSCSPDKPYVPQPSSHASPTSASLPPQAQLATPDAGSLTLLTASGAAAVPYLLSNSPDANGALAGAAAIATPDAAEESGFTSQRWSPFVFVQGPAGAAGASQGIAGQPPPPLLGVPAAPTTNASTPIPLDDSVLLNSLTGVHAASVGGLPPQARLLVRVPEFSVDREMVERTLNMSWSAALHRHVEHCLSARPPLLEDADTFTQEERSAASVYTDFRARQRALASLISVRLASGKSQEAYAVATKHFKSEKKEWSSHTQTMFTAIRYMQSMTHMVRAQAACRAHGAVIETSQFVLPQSALCEQMVHVLAPRPRAGYILRFGDARLKILRAKVYLKKELWRSYAAFNDSVRAQKYFLESVQDLCRLRRRYRESELFEALMERGAMLMQKGMYQQSVDLLRLAVQLGQSALANVTSSSSSSSSSRTAAAASATTAGTSAKAPPAFHSDLHLRGAGSGSLTSAEEHGVRSRKEEEVLEGPWRVAESTRMLALAFVTQAEHEVDFAERRRELSNAVNNAYASQAALHRWQEMGGTPKRALTAVPLSLIVMCRALLLLRQPKKAALLLEPLIEDKVNSAQVRPPMWMELLSPTDDPLTTEDVVLRTYVNSVRLNVFLLYVQCLSKFDGERTLRAARAVQALLQESEAWIAATQTQVRAIGYRLARARAAAAAAAQSRDLSAKPSLVAVKSSGGSGAWEEPNAVAGAEVVAPPADTAAATTRLAAGVPPLAPPASPSPHSAGDPSARSTPSLAPIEAAGPAGGATASSSPTQSPNEATQPAPAPASAPRAPSLAAAKAAAVAEKNTHGLQFPTHVVHAAPPLVVDSSDDAPAPVIRLSMESQSERVTAWRALWQGSSAIRKTARDLESATGDALCLLGRWEDALESYSRALVICQSEEEAAAAGEKPKTQKRAAGGAAVSRSASVAHFGASSSGAAASAGSRPGSTQLPPLSPHGTAGATQGTPSPPPPTDSMTGSPVLPIEDFELMWVQEEEEELDSAIASVRVSSALASATDLRAITAAEERQDFRDGEYRVLGKLAEVYRALDKAKMAIHYLKLVLEYAEETKNALLVYVSMLQLARLYTSIDAVDDAQAMWERVSALARQYGDTDVSRETLRNIVTGQAAAGMFPAVVTTATELNKLASEAEATDAAADQRFALEALASAHLQLAHYKECLEALDAREKVQERLGEWNGRLLELRARARLGLGEAPEALKVLHGWAYKARQLHNAVELAKASRALATAYASDGKIFRARRCHLSALRAFAAVATPLSREDRESVLDSARWLVHYYYLNTDEVQVDPSLEAAPPTVSPVNKRAGLSMFANNSSSSFEHDLHNNSGDLGAILAEDERMRAAKAAAESSQDGGAGAADDDDVDAFLGNLQSGSFASADIASLLGDGSGEGTSSSPKGGAATAKKTDDGKRPSEAPPSKPRIPHSSKAVSAFSDDGEEAVIAAAEEAEEEKEAREADPSSAANEGNPANTAKGRPSAPPPQQPSASAAQQPPSSLLANVSVCSRPAAAASGTDVLEPAPLQERSGAESGLAAAGKGRLSVAPAAAAAATGAGTATAAAAAAAAAATSVGDTRRAGNGLAPLPLPADLDYKNPSMVSTLCYFNAIEAMEWATKLLSRQQLLKSTAQLLSSLSVSGSGSSPATKGTGAIVLQAHQQQQLLLIASTCAIPYSPAEAVDMALLAYPRCTFVFYFAEYATESSSCYDVIVRPANHTHFIHRSAQVTTLKNYHDKTIVQTLAARAARPAAPPAAPAPPADGTAANPMLAAAAQQAAAPPKLEGEALERALDVDTAAKLQDLHDELWMPVLTGMKRAKVDFGQAECLIIVADPTLMHVPFAGLYPNPDNSMPGEGSDPLGVQASIVVTPSLAHIVYRGLSQRAMQRQEESVLASIAAVTTAAAAHPRASRSKSKRTRARDEEDSVMNAVFLLDDNSQPMQYTSKAQVREAMAKRAAAASTTTSASSFSSPNAIPAPADSSPLAVAAKDAATATVISRSNSLSATSQTCTAASNAPNTTKSPLLPTPSPTQNTVGSRQPSGVLSASSPPLPGVAAVRGAEAIDPFCSLLRDNDSDDDDNDDDGREEKGLGESAQPQQQPEDTLFHDAAAQWTLYVGCTRKELARSFSDRRARVVMVLGTPTGDTVRAADGVVAFDELLSTSRAVSAAAAARAAAAAAALPPANEKASPSRSTVASPRPTTAGSASPAAGPSTIGTVLATSAAASPSRRQSATPSQNRAGAEHAHGAAGGGGRPGAPPGLVHPPSLAHLDLFVLVIDRGVVPSSTDFVLSARACLHLGCPRVLMVALAVGTTLSTAHKEFLCLYLHHVERVQRWGMAYPYALALRVTMDAALREKQWPSSVWGAFSLFGAP